jgi:HSP20 family protein
MSELSIQKVPATDDRSLPIFAEFEELADRIRLQAYQLFAGRGATPGNALDDWLAAEREICWPAAELTERDSEFELDVALAGFAPEDITITATPRELMIKARRQIQREESQGEGQTRVRWSELSGSDVYRRIDLPNDVNVDAIMARLENGLLRIIAPKAQVQEAEPQQIEVTEGN